jgi:hypothetical protein
MPASLQFSAHHNKQYERDISRQNCPFSFSVGHGPVQQLDLDAIDQDQYPSFSSLLVLVPVQQLVDGSDPSFSSLLLVLQCSKS